MAKGQGLMPEIRITLPGYRELIMIGIIEYAKCYIKGTHNELLESVDEQFSICDFNI